MFKPAPLPRATHLALAAAVVSGLLIADQCHAQTADRRPRGAVPDVCAAVTAPPRQSTPQSRRRTDLDAAELECVYSLHARVGAIRDAAIMRGRAAWQAEPRAGMRNLRELHCAATQQAAALLDFEKGRARIRSIPAELPASLNRTLLVSARHPQTPQGAQAATHEAIRAQEMLFRIQGPNRSIDC